MPRSLSILRKRWAADKRGSYVLSGLLAAVGALIAFTGGYGWAPAGSECGWLLLVAFLANLAIALWDRSTLDIDTASGFIPITLAAICFGPIVTLVCAAVSSLPYLLVGPGMTARCLATRAFSGVVVACVLVNIGVDPRADPDGFLLASLGAAAAYQFIQLWVTTAVLTVEHGGDGLVRLRALGPRFGIALLLFGPMVVAFAYLMQDVPSAVLLATFAAAASHQLLITVARSRGYERLVSEMSAEIPGALLSALDAADAYTAQHSATVASYSYDIARACGFDDRRARQVHAAALLHDVGKIGVPDAVLNKPSKLDEKEWELMKRHPEMGASIVRRLPGFHVLEASILHHHERMNGTGYPQGIDAAEIPEEAQIIAVADTYSAITTTRSYRQAKPADFGMDELRKDAASGKLNDELVAIFLAILDENDMEYRTGQHTDLAREISRVHGWLDFADSGMPPLLKLGSEKAS